MVTETRHSGTFRTDYEADLARLDGFQALTADTDKLLHRLVRASRDISYRDADGREGTLTPFLENHVLTVLADIRRKRLADYGKSFAEANGTSGRERYALKLEKDIQDWTARLEAYLRGTLSTGSHGCPSAEVARELLDRLTSALQGGADGEADHRYYRMLGIVTAIQKTACLYRSRMEESGDTDPALALLIAHVKNYANIAEAFNQRFAMLPDLYSREVLHVAPCEATPDNVQLVITPASGGFTLRKGTAFAAGGELTYKTTQKEYISPMRIVSAQTIYKDESGLHLQTLDFENTDTAETLFTGGEELQTGWQIESPMLVLEEGRREVSVSLLSSRPQAESCTMQGFILQYATAEGWTEAETSCRLSSNGLTFGFTIERDGAAPMPCTPDLHGIETAYPALRILTANGVFPVWAEGMEFEEVRIEVNVSGIRNFIFHNDLGDTDTAQPFAPFGMQAERGAWFMFGSGETGMKPLKEVTLTGTWQKLPETRNGFDDIYKDYLDTDAASFRVKTAWLKDGSWLPCDNSEQDLFTFDVQGRFNPARFVFVFSPEMPDTHSLGGSYEYSRDKDGFFRVTLDSPSIGFGHAAYRSRFTEVMMHNSRCKKKELWTLPQEPSMPMLADVEMAYKAELKAPLTSPKGEIRITPIALSETSEAPPREGAGRIFPLFPAPGLLCLAFAGAAGEQRIRLYFDMTLPQDRLPYYNPRTDAALPSVWQYWNGTDWTDIPATDILADETTGLTKSGFVEINFSRNIPQSRTDGKDRLWLRAAIGGNASACLALRGVWTNSILVTADGGDGTSLPAGTIQGTAEEDPCIGSVTQPLPGFGGTPAKTEAQSAAHRTARISNRHRAVTRRDYEQILLEHFPEVDMSQCLSTAKESGGGNAAEVCLTVFCRAEDSKYFLSPPWKLNEMERTLRQYVPACVRLRVLNPVYEAVEVKCSATLHFGVQDTGKVASNLTTIVENYFRPWRRSGGFPVPGQVFSAKELCARMVNHEDLQRVTSLTVNGKEYMTADAAHDAEADTIRGSEAWSILLPEVEITLVSPDSGIGGNDIGSGFVIV